MERKEKSSPLNDMPLRQAGQSLDNELLNKALDGLLGYYMIGIVVSALCLMEWVAYLNQAPRHPVAYTVIALLVVAVCGYKIKKNSKSLEHLRLARRGERAVGQFLELFREDGAKVFHDLVGDNFNVDHVLVCSKGVIVVETKTYSKPKDGRVLFDGSKILIDGYNTGEKLLKQVRAEASWLKRLVKESTGRSVDVIPVIVFPGWYVESTKQGEASDVTVLNPRLLRGHVKGLPNVLSIEDVALISYHISRFSRAIDV